MRHIKGKHTLDKYQCEFCSTQFVELSRIRSHIAQEHSEELLQLGIQIHDGTSKLEEVLPLYPCKKCKVCFVQKEGLAKHSAGSCDQHPHTCKHAHTNSSVSTKHSLEKDFNSKNVLNSRTNCAHNNENTEEEMTIENTTHSQCLSSLGSYSVLNESPALSHHQSEQQAPPYEFFMEDESDKTPFEFEKGGLGLTDLPLNIEWFDKFLDKDQEGLGHFIFDSYIGEDENSREEKLSLFSVDFE